LDIAAPEKSSLDFSGKAYIMFSRVFAPSPAVKCSGRVLLIKIVGYGGVSGELLRNTKEQGLRRGEIPKHLRRVRMPKPWFVSSVWETGSGKWCNCSICGQNMPLDDAAMHYEQKHLNGGTQGDEPAGAILGRSVMTPPFEERPPKQRFVRPHCGHGGRRY